MDNYYYCNRGNNNENIPPMPPPRPYFPYPGMIFNNSNTEILLFLVLFLMMFTTYGRYY